MFSKLYCSHFVEINTLNFLRTIFVSYIFADRYIKRFISKSLGILSTSFPPAWKWSFYFKSQTGHRYRTFCSPSASYYVLPKNILTKVFFENTFVQFGHSVLEQIWIKGSYLDQRLWKLILHKSIISKNWNPPYWVPLHRFFKNWFLLIQKHLYNNYIQAQFTK